MSSRGPYLGPPEVLINQRQVPFIPINTHYITHFRSGSHVNTNLWSHVEHSNICGPWLISSLLNQISSRLCQYATEPEAKISCLTSSSSVPSHVYLYLNIFLQYYLTQILLGSNSHIWTAYLSRNTRYKKKQLAAY